MRVTTVRRAGSIALLLSLFAAQASAQFDTASVVGTVRDSSGAVIPGATVTLTNTATGVSATRTTNAEGNYEFFTVRPGIYVVTAEQTGFSIALVDQVQVQVAARLRVDLQMTVGQLSERVEVTASSPLIETDTSQRGQVITGAQTQALPLNGREYSALALLTTGVRQSALGRATGTPREGAFNVNGLRSTFNNFLIDGVDNNSYGTSNQGFSNQVMQPAPDAVDEFRVVTNNESAEYGRSAGATINVAYRSGTNDFHGSAWEFNRNTALNATGYFTPPSGEKPPLRRNQFGGVFGGPIVRSKAFFFADYEGFRQTRKQVATTTIATPDQRRGLLSVAIRDPRTGVTYPSGTPIPMTAFASRVLGGLPDPTVAGATANNYVILQEFTNETDKAGGKVDLRVNPSLSLFGRYGWRDLATDDQPPIPLPSGGDGNGRIYARNKQLVLGTTYVTGASSLMEIRFGWSNTQAGKNPPALGSTSASEAFGITGLPSDPRISGGLPTQQITGYTSLGRQATNPQWQYPTVWNPKVNYTWTMGRQSLKAGYEYQNISVEVQDVNPLYGRDAYTGQFSRPAGVGANNIYNLADFMLGLRSQYAISNVLVATMVRDMHFGYVQDDVRVNDRLTLNLGLRYEYATPMWEADNMLSNYDPAARRMVAARDGSVYDRTLINPDRNNFGPRLGFALTPMLKTAIRGGYGVSYVHVNRTGAADVLSINGPQVINAVVNQTNPADPSFRTTEQGYPAGLADPSRFNPLTANVTHMASDFQSGRVQSYFLSLQREFGPNMMVDVAYVGNRGDSLLLIANANQASTNNAAGTIPLQARRPIPEFSDITYVFNGGKSRYNALQTKFEWRMGSSVTLLSSLTLSKTRDNGAQSLEGQNGNFPAPQNFYDLDAEYALSGYHQPYNSTTSFVWSLPFGQGRRWGGNVSNAVDALIGGWQISGINTVTPGEPVTFTYTPLASFVVSGIQQDFRGANNYRPNVTCDPYAPAGQQTIANWFNKDCVVIPTDPSQPFGNAGRNTVRGKNFWQFDISASKTVPLGQRVKVEARLEVFNLFDRANFLAPSGIRSSPAFGTITSTYDPRQLQLGIKLHW